MKKKKKKEKKRTLFEENSTLLFLTLPLEFNGRLNREKERKRRNKRKKRLSMVSVLPSSFSDRVFTRTRENIHLEGNAFRFASKCGTFG